MSRSPSPHRNCNTIEPGYIFRTSEGAPLDPDNFHKRHVVPLLKKAGLYQRGMRLNALRRRYVSLLADLGEDDHYISRQVGLSSVALTRDVYKHTLSTARVRPCAASTTCSLPLRHRPITIPE
jgi:integrase